MKIKLKKHIYSILILGVSTLLIWYLNKTAPDYEVISAEKANIMCALLPVKSKATAIKTKNNICLFTLYIDVFVVNLSIYAKIKHVLVSKN